MAESVKMPALGESVTEGTVTRWLKEVGEDVEVDEPLLEVSTDKVDTEIPSPAAGTLTELFVEEDETVEIGARLARIGGDASGGSGPASSGSSGADASAPESSGSASSGSDAAPVAPEGASEPEVAPEEPQRQSEPEAPSSAPEPAQATEDYNSPASQVDGSVKPPTGEDTGGGAGAPASGTVSAYVTPLVRKLAAENGVDLAALKGTGVGGRIRKQDVLDAAEAAKAPQESAPAASQQPAEPASQQASSQQAPSSSAPSKPSAPSGGASAAPEVAAKRGTTEKMTRLRKVIAQRMVESLQVSAQLTTVVEVDVTRIARLRARAKADFAAREGVGLSFLPFFALASIEALKAFPQVNASIDGDSIVYHAQENLGIAVDTERGLLVPVIKDAGDLNIAGIAKKIADLAARTRDNKVTPDELGGGTFTLTNTGSRGALFDTPIINQPQVAILGTGSVVKRPVVVPDGDGGESIAVRSMIYLALSYDHRLVDGADAARFLSTMKARLEEGAFEGDLGL